MTVREVIEEEIARAFAAGAQWCHIHRHGQDSARMGRELRQWETDPNYKRLLKDQQRRAAEAIPRAILDAVHQQMQQRELFDSHQGRAPKEKGEELGGH